MTDGDVCHYCKICDGGDFDLCVDCYAIPSKRCPHTLPLCKITKIKAGTPSISFSQHDDETDSPFFTPNAPASSQESTPGWGASTPASGSSTPGQEPSEIDKLGKKFQETQLKESLLQSIVSEKPNVKWEDVAGLEAAKEELQESIVFPLRFPQMFTGKRKARRGILLYGPPGTGKSYLAKAVATEVEYTLFSISSSDVMSKWYGESEQLVRGLFQLAREKKPSIIFIDEIDALCANRDGSGGGGGGEDTARMKTEFLIQMDGVGNDNTGVLVLAASNLPWVLDPAMRRRFQKRIHIPLPEHEARKQLFRINIGDLAPDIHERDIDELARRTQGFSGSDIAIIIQDALMIPVKKVHMAKYFKKVYDKGPEQITPCEAHESGAQPMTWKQVPPKKLREPAISTMDFFSVLSGVKASVGEEDILKCQEWTQQYGSEGA
ncbi:AAA-domain-containing protein [Microthyrium microscopicum]|uniref:AAA-domain-containing protein n=1 Tax=Microthyrium microscopicum TaxID=703497 RepID=A0A6A6TZ85_9PEZI|nr:AAA-domain-containing protein [Microthyrium microscopicum]